MHPEMRYKRCKFCENRAKDTPLWGVYIPHFGQIWVKISILGVLHPCRCTGPLLHAKFHPHRCNVSPLPGEKPQNGAKEDKRGRYTDYPVGCHSIRTNHWPTSIIRPHFLCWLPSCRNPPTLSWLETDIKYAGLHTQCRGCIPSGLVLTVLSMK